jgi:hypothetical protein
LIVYDEDKNIVAEKIVVADNFLDRLKGLMFVDNLESGSGLLLKNCNSVHTFFMLIPIHLVFLDEDNRVVKIKKNNKPNRVILPIQKAQSVLELSAKTKINFKKGEKLTIK